jgi:hypothetical protein
MRSCGWHTAIMAWMSNPAKRAALEPHAVQQRYPRLLDDHERRGRQPGEKRPGLADAGGPLYGVEHILLLQAQCRLVQGAAVALQDWFVEADGFTRLLTATRLTGSAPGIPAANVPPHSERRGPTIGNLSINKTNMSRMEKSVSLAQVGRIRNLGRVRVFQHRRCDLSYVFRTLRPNDWHFAGKDLTT